MKKILYIVQADSTTGSGKCALALIKELQGNEEFEPIIVTQHKNDINNYCDQHCIENYHIHYARTCCLGMGFIGRTIAFFSRPILNRLALKKLSNKTKMKEISVIHTNDSSIDFGAFLHRKLNIPHIWHVREFLVFEKKLSPIVKKLPLYVDKNSSAIITVSKVLENYLIQKGCFSKKIKTIYDGIDTQKYNSKKICSKPNKYKYSIVCVGAITPEKGQETLIDALALLPDKDKSRIHVDFWGNIDIPKYKAILDDKINKNHLQSCVSFKGFSSNIEAELMHYDIGIQPSHSEGFSLVTAEYMAAGLSVIAAKEGAIPELIRHKKNGYLYEDYNEKDLRDYILHCIDNPNDASYMASQAQNEAKKRFSQKNNLVEILNLYKTICI